MAAFLLQDNTLDLFAGAVGTLLTAHTPDVGGPWSNGTDAAMVLDGAGSCYQPTTTGEDNPTALTPPLASPTQLVQARVVRFSPAGPLANTGIVARYQDDSNYYQVTYHPDYDLVILWRRLAAGKTDLADYPAVITDGQSIGLGLYLNGDQLTVLLAGEPQTPVTDAELPDAGRAGLFNRHGADITANTGTHLADFIAAATP